MTKRLASLGCALAVALSLASPGWSRQADPQGPPSLAAAPFRLIDRRPADDMRSRSLSRWMGSCDYGVFVLPETGGSAGRMDKLAADLKASLGQRLDGHEIVVRHYVLYVNMANQLTADAMATGALYGRFDGSARGSKCAPEQTSGGWYSSAEISSPYPPLIVEIEVAVDGRPLKTRAVYSPDESIIPMDRKYSKPPLAAALRATMTKANEALAEQLAGQLLQAS